MTTLNDWRAYATHARTTPTPPTTSVRRLSPGRYEVTRGNLTPEVARITQTVNDEHGSIEYAESMWAVLTDELAAHATPNARAILIAATHSDDTHARAAVAAHLAGYLAQGHTLPDIADACTRVAEEQPPTPTTTLLAKLAPAITHPSILATYRPRTLAAQRRAANDAEAITQYRAIAHPGTPQPGAEPRSARSRLQRSRRR